MSQAVTQRRPGLELFAAGRGRQPLPGGGARVKKGLDKLGIASLQDLLQHYPRRHVDRSELSTVRQLRDVVAAGFTGEVQVHATVRGIRGGIPTRTGKRMVKARIEDETGAIEVTWFNQDWVARVLKPGAQAFFYGRLGVFGRKLQMTAPRFEVVRSGLEPFNVGRIIPIYPATADLSSDRLRRLIWESLEQVEHIVDPLPEDLRCELGLMTRDEAIRLIHFPESRDDVIKARRRLVFDELFTLQLGLVYRKRQLERTVQGIAHAPPTSDSYGSAEGGNRTAPPGAVPAPSAGTTPFASGGGGTSLAQAFVAQLPFELTAAQRRACEEVAADMSRRFPMHRLLEGEVGSGKTVVALFACLVAIDGGYQSAFMAPTEVLAEQHNLTINELLDRAFGPAEARNLFAASSRRPVVRLLTGSTPAPARQEILREVAAGEVDLLVGTHALIEESVAFARLGVAVVDEQHRFGVHQRKRLRDKGAVGEPDVLVMTATPIPRTLAVTIYGDLDVSILDELPKGRQPITTTIAAGDEARAHAYELIRQQVASGRQAFIVYALRDESDKLELRSAKAEADRLSREAFCDLRVGLVHGDMKSAEKERAMTAFRDGNIDVLVATTVIEVGVDVPNATVMLIEDAERFGLAQLHQLRGRIGRGTSASYCVVATDLDLDRTDDPSVAVAAERLRALASTRDGFKLSLVDLEQRGEGELLGARQSGMPQLKLARVLRDQDVVKQARDLAVRLLDDDPELRAYEHTGLEREMRARFPADALDVVHSG